jgi:hypothetical protein
MPGKKLHRSARSSQRVPEVQTHRKLTALDWSPRTRELHRRIDKLLSAPRFTIEDAFDPEFAVRVPAGSDSLRRGYFDVERGIRAVAFLLDSAAGEGNAPIDGAAAMGLGALLSNFANEIARLEDHRLRWELFRKLESEEEARPRPESRRKSAAA